jgi:hypothetical protein
MAQNSRSIKGGSAATTLSPVTFQYNWNGRARIKAGLQPGGQAAKQNLSGLVFGK